MNIGQPKRIIEIEPATLPIPGEIEPAAAPLPLPEEPALEPEPAAPPEG
ncbi:MAG: hypothetical protein ACRDGK_01695 [Actinomycetota bacterium]